MAKGSLVVFSFTQCLITHTQQLQQTKHTQHTHIPTNTHTHLTKSPWVQRPVPE